MLALSLTSVGTNLLVKTWGFLSSASILRHLGPVVANKHFSTTSDGPPKRPKTSYMQFVHKQWPAVVRQYPDVKVVDLSRKIAQQWRELSPEQKKPFEEAAAVARKEYSADMQKYMAQLTPAQSAALKQERRAKMAKRKAVRKKRELKNLGKPKRPKTALFIFISENFAEAKGTFMLAKTKTLMDEWKKMTAEQKQVYVQQAEDDKVRYANEMKSWEEHMSEIGREDLIRQAVRKAKSRSKKSSRVKVIKTTKAASGKVAGGVTVSKTARKARSPEE